MLQDLPKKLASSVPFGDQAAQMREPGARMSGLRRSASWKLKSFILGPRAENNATCGADLWRIGIKPSPMVPVPLKLFTRPVQSLVVEVL